MKNSLFKIIFCVLSVAAITNVAQAQCCSSKGEDSKKQVITEVAKATPAEVEEMAPKCCGSEVAEMAKADKKDCSSKCEKPACDEAKACCEDGKECASECDEKKSCKSECEKPACDEAKACCEDGKACASGCDEKKACASSCEEKKACSAEEKESDHK